jgi:hypothetical protein
MNSIIAKIAAIVKLMTDIMLYVPIFGPISIINAPANISAADIIE